MFGGSGASGATVGRLAEAERTVGTVGWLGRNALWLTVVFGDAIGVPMVSVPELRDDVAAVSHGATGRFTAGGLERGDTVGVIAGGATDNEAEAELVALPYRGPTKVGVFSRLR